MVAGKVLCQPHLVVFFFLPTPWYFVIERSDLLWNEKRSWRDWIWAVSCAEKNINQQSWNEVEKLTTGHFPTALYWRASLHSTSLLLWLVGYTNRSWAFSKCVSLQECRTPHFLQYAYSEIVNILPELHSTSDRLTLTWSATSRLHSSFDNPSIHLRYTRIEANNMEIRKDKHSKIRKKMKNLFNS